MSIKIYKVYVQTPCVKFTTYTLYYIGYIIGYII